MGRIQIPQLCWQSHGPRFRKKTPAHQGWPPRPHQGPRATTEVLVRERHELPWAAMVLTCLQNSATTFTWEGPSREAFRTKSPQVGDGVLGHWSLTEGPGNSTGQGPPGSTLPSTQRVSCQVSRRPRKEPTKTAAAPGELRAAALSDRTPGVGLSVRSASTTSTARLAGSLGVLEGVGRH